MAYSKTKSGGSIKNRLSRHIILFLIAPVLLICILQFLKIKIFADRQAIQTKKTIQHLADVYSRTLAINLKKSDSEAVRILEQMTRPRNNFSKIALYAPSGDLLFSTDKSFQNINTIISKLEKAIAADEPAILKKITLDGKTYGYLLIRYDIDNIEKITAYSALTLSSSVFIAIFAMILINYIADKWIISPLNFLKNTSRQGESIEDAYTASDEIEKMIFEYRAMEEKFHTTICDYEIVIHEYRAMSEELTENEKNLRITLDSIADGVIATDSECIVQKINKAALKITGLSETEAVGKHINDILNEAGTAEASLKAIDDIVLAANKAARRISIVNGANRIVIISVNIAVRYDDSDNPAGMVISFRDITEHVHTEEQLRQAQKMDAVGQLASGVAHDFNNMIGAITGAAELMHFSLENKKELNEYIEQIVSACRKASKLTRRLLLFSKSENTKIETADVHLSILSAVDLLKRSIDKKIEIKTCFKNKKLFCLFDDAHLENILLNLGLNARDAMTDGGILKFRTDTVSFNHEDCSRSGFKIYPGKYVRITCSDTGEGMTEETRQRIFEPFFTTKETGKGTGLGLSSAYALILEYNSMIKVTSSPGEGTIFDIYIPMSEEGNLQETINTHLGKLPEKTILLVDDEKNLLKVLKQYLVKLGLKVISASNGIEAVDQFRKFSKSIDLIILDMMMPGLHGKEVYFTITEENPNIKFLISSGFSKDEILNELQGRQNVCDFLQKPYSLRDLNVMLNNALKYNQIYDDSEKQESDYPC